VGRRLKMVESIKLLLGYAIFAVAAIGFLSFVNAEEATINVPFQSQGLRCDYQEDSTTETYVCIFIADKPTGITVTQEGLTEEEIEIIKQAKHCRETGYTDPECPEEPCIYDYKHGTCYKPDEIPEEFGGDIVEDPDKLIDPRVEICENKKNLSPEEYEYCRLLTAIDECYRGFGKLETIQEVSSFEVTRLTPNVWENWEYKLNSYLRDMVLKYEECRALQTEHDDVLSAMYWDFVVDGIMEPQLYHGDIPTQDPYQTQVLTKKSWLHTLGNAYEEICYNQNYDDTFKIQSGCEITYEEGSGYIPNPDKNMDDYYLSLTPMQRFNAYMDNPEEYEKDDLLYGHVGDWKRLKGLQR